MRLEQLTYVVEVADSKQINVVANKLFVTPQNISKSIKQLETELNVKIFDRTKYGMFLTSDGQLIYNVARNIQQQLDFLESHFSKKFILPADDIHGTLNIVAPAALNIINRDLLQKLITEYPHIAVTYHEQETTAIYEQLSNHEHINSHDIFFTSTGKNMHPLSSDLQNYYDIYFLKEEMMCVLMSIKSPYAKQQTISLRTLATLPLAGFVSLDHQGNVNRPFVEKLLQEYGLKLNFVFLSDSYYNWDLYIRDGIAYGLVGHDYMRSIIKEKGPANVDLITIPLKEKISTTHMMFIPKDKAPSPALEIFRSMVFKHFSDSYHQIK